MWGDNYNGGDNHDGKCHECGRSNYSCHDGLCDECEEHKPIKCKECGDFVDPAYMNQEHGCCIVCLDERAYEATTKILDRIQMSELCEEMMNDIQIITKNYKL
jgi:hypothetical protein